MHTTMLNSGWLIAPFTFAMRKFCLIFGLLGACSDPKYVWEGIRIFLSLDDSLCLRETSTYHATCDWFRPGWTVALSRWHTYSVGRLGRLMLPGACCWLCSQLLFGTLFRN